MKIELPSLSDVSTCENKPRVNEDAMVERGPRPTLRQVPVAAIKVGKRHRNDLGDIETLAASIRAVGLIHPIVVDADFRLLAGRRRLEAVKTLGWTRVPVIILEERHEAG